MGVSLTWFQWPCSKTMWVKSITYLSYVYITYFQYTYYKSIIYLWISLSICASVFIIYSRNIYLSIFESVFLIVIIIIIIYIVWVWRSLGEIPVKPRHRRLKKPPRSASPQASKRPMSSMAMIPNLSRWGSPSDKKIIGTWGRKSHEIDPQKHMDTKVISICIYSRLKSYLQCRAPKIANSVYNYND